jgi:hypothetical protein
VTVSVRFAKFTVYYKGHNFAFLAVGGGGFGGEIRHPLVAAQRRALTIPEFEHLQHGSAYSVDLRKRKIPIQDLHIWENIDQNKEEKFSSDVKKNKWFPIV